MHDQLTQAYEALHTEAEKLAGGLADAAQRAVIYRHMYRFSGGNHIFPLIAAHGALWSRSYFLLARKLAHALSWQYFTSPAKRREQLERLTVFENTLRDINRRVCIDTYVNLHFITCFGDVDGVSDFIDTPLLEAMNRLDAARRAGRSLSNEEKLAIYKTHFYNEQQHVVGPTIAAAVADFDWPLVRAIALRPPIQFAYFPRGRYMLFRNFADQHERIARGLTAFDIAAEQGWKQVEETLEKYAALPHAAFVQPDAYFGRLRTELLSC